MTRFIMNTSQAVELILKAAKIAKGGEIFILKMPAVRIEDLAEVMIEKLAPKYGYKPEEIEIKNIGKRVGEKMYEELMIEDEAESAYEDEEMFVVLPKSFDITGRFHYNLPDNFKKTQKRGYSSKYLRLLTKEEIKVMIRELILS